MNKCLVLFWCILCQHRFTNYSSLLGMDDKVNSPPNVNIIDVHVANYLKQKIIFLHALNKLIITISSTSYLNAAKMTTAGSRSKKLAALKATAIYTLTKYPCNVNVITCYYQLLYIDSHKVPLQCKCNNRL